MGPEDRPSTSPWVVASDDFNSADKRIESWREAGFTTALVLPEEAIIAGQGSMIDFNDERVSQMIVRSHAALRIGCILQHSVFQIR